MARIRSIKPEFWTSESIARLPHRARLTFIGLWSYVDDNGVGRDVERLIAAALYPLEEDPREGLAMVREDLATLSRHSRIVRYEVEGKPYLFVEGWDEHQKIDKPNKGRYPRPDAEGAQPTPPPTCDDVAGASAFAEPSRNPREDPSPGAGNRGTGEQGTGRTAEADAAHRPRATRLPHDWQPSPDLVAYARQGGLDPQRTAEDFRDFWHAKSGRDATKLDWPATWRRWCRTEADRRAPARHANAARPSTTDQRVHAALDLAARYADEDGTPAPHLRAIAGGGR